METVDEDAEKEKQKARQLDIFIAVTGLALNAVLLLVTLMLGGVT